ncbi:MAG: hypothetical protein IT258_01630 [Saprospiraceae bacterium]|nr:hypothetical protein [Saprospiraceae bacterium]
MKNSSCFSFCATLLLAFVSTIAFGQKAPYLQRFHSVKTVEFNIYHGDLKVVENSADEVEISGISQSPAEMPEAKVNGKTLVFTEDSKVDGSSPDWPTWTVKVPKHTDLNIQISGGNVSIENVTGEIKCNLGAGDFTLSHFEGEMELNAGTATIDLTASSGHFKGNTGTGNVHLNDVQGSFLFNSGTGNLEAVNTTVTGASQLNSGTGNVFFSGNGAVRANLSLNSGTANTSIELSDLKFNGTLQLRCSKSGGRIEAPFTFDEETTTGRGKNCNLLKSKKFGESDVVVSVSSGLGTASAK